jgi:hypothetical protein
LNLINAQIIGLGEFNNRIKSAENEIKAEVDAELQSTAMEIVEFAKKDLNNQGGDTGRLYNSIQYAKEDNLSYKVFIPNDVYYAPYIEFGTKSKVKVEPGFEEVAQEFKGRKSNSSLTLIEAIRAWVLRKGIESEEKKVNRAAYLIARSIYKNGINPKPFFFKQVAPARIKLMNRIKSILDGI